MSDVTWLRAAFAVAGFGALVATVLVGRWLEAESGRRREAWLVAGLAFPGVALVVGAWSTGEPMLLWVAQIFGAVVLAGLGLVVAALGSAILLRGRPTDALSRGI